MLNILSFFNEAKSLMLSLSLPQSTERLISQQVPFSWAQSKLPYLGVHLTTYPTTALFEVNYRDFLRSLPLELQKRRTLDLSPMGSIATFKMLTLPKLLHLFRTLPTLVPSSSFGKTQQIVSKFVWNCKRPRCSLHTRIPTEQEEGWVLSIFSGTTRLLSLISWSTDGAPLLKKRGLWWKRPA